MNRALIYAHYDADALVSESVVYALTAFRQYFSTIYFVTVSDIDLTEQNKLRDIADRVIVRPNVGYDFGSWKEGFARLRSPTQYDEVVFANDSVFGPVTDFGQFLAKSERLGADLWGASINRQFRPHVQSYFMAFRRSLIASGMARRFWNSVRELPDKNAIIWEFEIGLSDQVLAEGFTIGAVSDLGQPTNAMRQRAAADNRFFSDRASADDARLRAMREDNPNPVQFFWAESMRQGNPFIKIELLRDNPPGADLQRVSDVIVAGRRLDLDLIRRHFWRVAPRASWLISDRRARGRLRQAFRAFRDAYTGISWGDVFGSQSARQSRKSHPC